MDSLLSKKCIPCEGGTLPLTDVQVSEYLKEVSGWSVGIGHEGDIERIVKEFKFKDFAEAMVFANKIAVLADQEGHHPDLGVSWGKVVVELSTHAIGGLSENDFILAAKIDALK